MRVRKIQYLLFAAVLPLIASCDDESEDKGPGQQEEAQKPGQSGSQTGGDSEDASIIVSPVAITISEVNQSARVTTKLGREPEAAVTLNAVIADHTEAVVTPASVVIEPAHWNEAVYFQVDGVDDKTRDGDQKTTLTFEVASSDDAFGALSPVRVAVTVVDDGTVSSTQQPPEEEEPPVIETPEGAYKIRLMAANITSGSKQQYEAEGIRIFKALNADIIMIQEFNYANDAIKSFVSSTFGSAFAYTRSEPDVTSPIPNGIISRYPILDSGFWRGKTTPTNRNYDWALIDLPGNVELLAVSVHLLTDTAKQRREMTDVVGFISSKLAELKKANSGVTYIAAIGGDFNTKTREYAESQFSSVFKVKNGPGEAYPVDQNGNECTSGERDDPYDWVLVTSEFDACEIPVVIGKHSYPNGHVFDSRVYGNASAKYNNEIYDLGCQKHGYVDELGDLPTQVKTGDSDATNMQHMAVIRDFVYVVGDKSEETAGYCHFK